MWKAFKDNGKLYATCEKCNADFTLKEAKTYAWCPRCGNHNPDVEMPKIEPHYKENARGKRIGIRIDEDEEEILDALNVYYGTTTSELIRRMIHSRYEALSEKGRL